MILRFYDNRVIGGPNFVWNITIKDDFVVKISFKTFHGAHYIKLIYNWWKDVKFEWQKNFQY